ncbi:MAG TPA: thiamine-phosphate kinase [Planctomycetes bacterium]|nr:thiamine-phosphate kinase [Fuerstiella sp.]HIK91825.1 thiamine-phosphate kinase [Planctomycetota bacterium]
MNSELQFIRALQNRFPVRSPVQVGIGDDGAVVDCSMTDRQVVVIDMLLDGVHFDLKDTTPHLVGRKAMAVNLSDLAAMGCWPTAAFVSLAVPKSLDSADAFLEQVFAGIRELSTHWDVCVAGGDTNTWDGPFVIDVCLTGIPVGQHPVLRSGARPGDVLLVTGPLGGSLNSGRHLTFTPRLELAKWLVQNYDIHAMMDISDGLAIDLHRMMEASETGADVLADAVPIHPDVRSTARNSSLLQALSDGEDFELLLAMSLGDFETLNRDAERSHDFHRIGVVRKERRCQLIDGRGRTTALHVAGWQHEIS